MIKADSDLKKWKKLGHSNGLQSQTSKSISVGYYGLDAGVG